MTELARTQTIRCWKNAPRGVGLLCIAAIAAIASLYWHFSSPKEPGSPPVRPPLALKLYESKPNTPLTVSVDVSSDNGRLRATVNLLEPEADTTVLLIANHAGVGNYSFVHPLRHTQTPGDAFGEVVDLLDFPAHPNGQGSETQPIAEFNLPADAVSRASTGVQIRMPTLAANEKREAVNYPFASTEPLFHTRVRDLYSNPDFVGPEVDLGRPSAYRVNDGGVKQKVRALFAVPARLNATETFAMQGLEEDNTILANSPASGTLINGTFRWTGGLELTPFLSAADPDQQSARETKAFLLGVALATLAAAVIAVIQELSDEWLSKQTSKVKTEIRRARSSPIDDR